ncbi:phosphate transport system permease protein PstA [Candidatus Termititenax persephonae]|uniref:Phosphate transport system permease protein PstA n=1 Tax=Candidatus Termititenax persephonae TaxID=2218525 RepID=A0A388TJH2_9BACT|nr:phosphate transport system permease protein PstA [Candidatus Termititenax persephonae]
MLPLVLILGYLLGRGAASLNWQFFCRAPQPLGEAGGGIANALVGSLLLLGVAFVLAAPLGLLVGIYLSENKTSRLADWTRLAVEILQGVPSIVVGMVIYIWLVLPFKNFSTLAGGAALALLMLPIIVRSAEETLRLIPSELSEAALALGVPHYRTVWRVIVPTGLSGIVTGLLLGLARAAGETAPLLFTAFGNPFLSFNLVKPIESLPHLIFYYATSPYEEWQRLAWGASFVLVVGVLGLNLTAKFLTRRWRAQF